MDKNTNNNDGFSFLSDQENVSIVVKCQAFVKGAVQDFLNRKSVERKKIISEWETKAEGIHMRFLALIYSAGGAPPRSTELGSVLVQNTLSGIRAIYCEGPEVIVAPGYAKQRRLTGVVRPFFLLLDRRSGVQYKIFEILVRPLYVEMCNSKRRNQVSTRLAIGRSSNDLADPLRGILKGSGIKLPVSKYRQFFGAYAKRNGDLFRAVTIAVCAKNGDGILNIPVGVKAMLTQGARSAMTGRLVYGNLPGRCGLNVGYDESLEVMYRSATTAFHRDCGLTLARSVGVSIPADVRTHTAQDEIEASGY